MKSKTAWLAGAAAMVAGAGAPQLAMAQEGVQTEEIIVTARKVEESIQDIPVSIAAFSGEQLQERGLEDLTEIARATPGFAFENYNGGFSTPVIRGQSQTRLTGPVQNVATFYNGVYLQRGYMADPSLLNIGRVEILRGPQSAALGRNAFAGAVNFISREPTDDLQAFALASGGENEYEKYELSIDGPIVPGFVRGSLAYGSGAYDGAWENGHPLANAPGARTEGNLGGYEYETYALGLNVEPTSDLEFNFNYISTDRDIESSPMYVVSGSSVEAFNTLNCSPNPNPGWANRNMLFCGVIPTSPTLAPGETRRAGLTVDPRSGLTITSDVLSFDATWDISDTVSLNYLYGHTEGSFEGSGATTRDPEVGWAFFGNLADRTGNGSIESDSHEVRLVFTPTDNLTAYIGAYSSDTDDLQQSVNLLWVPQTVGPFFPAISLSGPGNEANSLNITEVTSFFAFLEYAAGPWTFSIEGRQTDEEQTEVDRLPVTPTRASIEFDYFTPRATVSYDFTEDNRLYFSYAEGVKAGGFNTGGSNPAVNYSVDQSQATYETEENRTYEIGSRNEFADGRFVLNGTVFYIETESLQVSRNNLSAPFGGTVVGNLGGAETWGAELEARLQATESLSLYAGIGYANAEYASGTIDASNVLLQLCAANTVCSPTGNIGGNRIERSPEWNANVGFSFDHALTSDMDYYIRGSVSYVGEQFADNTNVGIIDDRLITDASLGVTRGGLEARLSADNLFDEEYVASAFNVAFGASPFFSIRTLVPNLGDRRRVAFTLSYRY